MYYFLSLVCFSAIWLYWNTDFVHKENHVEVAGEKETKKWQMDKRQMLKENDGNCLCLFLLWINSMDDWLLVIGMIQLVSSWKVSICHTEREKQSNKGRRQSNSFSILYFPFSFILSLFNREVLYINAQNSVKLVYRLGMFLIQKGRL